jgi:hypothetical protein
VNPRQAAQAALAAPTYRYIQGAMLVVLVIAFTTSFESGSEGAKRLGYPEDFIAALPLVCDVIAGVATFIHGRVRKDAQMRRLSAQFVLVPMLLSWGANSVDHVNRAGAGDWATAGVIAWYTGVVIGAGICPVAVAALLHLSTKYVDFEQRQNARTSLAETRSKATSVKPRTDPAPTKPVTIADAVAADEQPEAEQPTATGLTVAEWYALNPTATAKEIQLATGCARSYSYRLVKENAS